MKEMILTEVIVGFQGIGFRYVVSNGDHVIDSGVSARTTYTYRLPVGSACMISASKGDRKITRYISSLPPCRLSVFFSFSDEPLQRFMLTDAVYGLPIGRATLFLKEK